MYRYKGQFIKKIILIKS